MAIVSKTRLQVRHMAALHLADYKVSTADSGTATTIVDADLSGYGDDYFKGWELYVHTGTNNTKSRLVTAYTSTTGTFTFATMTTANDSTSQFELHRSGDGWPTVAEYNQAINMAINKVARQAVVDQIDVSIALERDRRYYDIPTDFIYLYRLLVDREVNSGDRIGSYEYELDQDFRQVAGNVQLAQGFKLTNLKEGLWVDGVYMYMRKVGSPTENLRLELYTDNAGEPSTTLVHDPAGSEVGARSKNVAGADIGANYRWIFFELNNPVWLANNTVYHIVIKDAAGGAATTNAYFQVGIDQDSLYPDGKLNRGTSVPAWTAVSGDDMLFRIRPLFRDEWELNQWQWEIVRSATRQLRINVEPVDGMALRLIGLRYAKEPSADTSTVDVDPARLALMTANVLAPSIPRQHVGNRQVDAQYLSQKSELAERGPWPQIGPNAKHVEPQ